MKKHFPFQTASKVHVSAETAALSAGRPTRYTAVAIAFVVALAGVLTIIFSRAVTTTPTLYISPASQSVAIGSDVTVNVTIDTASTSVNTVQTVVTYDANKFSFVGMTPGASFSAAFPNSASSGSISLTAGSTIPVSGIQTVATITLRATSSGSAPITLAGVCPAGDYGSTCSAAYDSVTSENVLNTVTSGTYTVDPVTSPPPSPTPTPTPTPTPPPTQSPPPTPSTVKLYLSPASQTVIADSNITISVIIDTAGKSVNTVQTVLSWPSDKFSFVSANASSAFSAAFPNTNSSGSLTFSAGSTGGVSGIQTVATVILKAKASGSAAIQLSSVCASGNFSSSCSAAYDSTTSDNVLNTVTGGSYSVGNRTPAPAPSPSPGPSPGPGPAPSPSPAPRPQSSTSTSPSPTPPGSVTTQPAPSSTGTAGSPTTYGTDETYATEALTKLSIALQILDDNGKPIAKAKVTIAGLTGTTDKGGNVTIKNVPAGKQTVTVKSGGKTTTDSIRVGQIDPATGAYKQQKFSLTAGRGTSTTPYIIVGLIVLLAGAAMLMVPNGVVSKLAQKIRKGPGSKPGGGGDASRPTGSDLPTKIITPNSSSQS